MTSFDPGDDGTSGGGTSGGGPGGDGKEPGAMRTIGEVARALGIRQHVLRYWEERFPGLKPVKRTGGRRYYRPEDVALVARIDRLVHREGYTLRGARLALAGAGASAGASAGAETPARPGLPDQGAGAGDMGADMGAGVRERLLHLRATLSQALARA